MEHVRQQVALHDMRFYAFHGYYSEEQILGNEFIVTIRVAFERGSAGKDELANTVNYEILYEIARREMQLPRKLLETVAESILHRILGDFSFVDEIEVRIQKNHPPFGGDEARASVSLSWVR